MHLPAGIHKEVIRQPPSLKYLAPHRGDEVEAHYEIEVADRKLYSSRDEEQPRRFKVSSGDVFEGLDLAVCSMRKGEKSRFTVDASHAYGDAGDEALGVPPGSTVTLELELLQCPLREDLFEDGGALKLIVAERDANARHPRRADEVQISYKVTVDDAGVLMASRHAVYTLGSEQLGSVARVMDKALLSMRRGDEALVSCAPDYLFGPGQGAHAGKAASIAITLEEIFECHDVSLGLRDKTVLRKRIKEGSPAGCKAHDTSKVKILVKSVSANGHEALPEGQGLDFVAGDGEVCDALEGAVLGLRAGDEALVRCETADSLSGGPAWLPASLEPPVMIRISVVSCEQAKEKWDLSSTERLERARGRRRAAGEIFKAGRTRLAAQHYEAIADLFTKLDYFPAQEQGEAAELRRVANLNRAMCMLKMGEFGTVIGLATAVLKEDPGNVKALFRRAKAYFATKEYDGAVADLKRLLEIEPANADGRALMKECRGLQKEREKKDGFTFAKMVSGLGDLPERTCRKEDDVVVMPNIDEEFKKLMQEQGLTVRPKAPQGGGEAE